MRHFSPETIVTTKNIKNNMLTEQNITNTEPEQIEVEITVSATIYEAEFGEIVS